VWSGWQLFLGSGGQVDSCSWALVVRLAAVPGLWWSGRQLFLGSGGQVGSFS
jgi:hypothetical protein